MPLSHSRPGLIWTDHVIDVPLNHADPAGPRIEVFARELAATAQLHKDLPYLLFLQGGPGRRADRPTSASAWISRALEGYRIVLLDQRGTGRSTPANRQTLAKVGDDKAIADYLRHMRADSIVRDAEIVRRHLASDRRWSVLGQSFGGFCALTYLSYAPLALREVMIAGGLPSLTAHPDDVYRAAYPRVLAANQRFFERYPGDRKVVREVMDHLGGDDCRMPTGERLTPQRFQLLGTVFGLSARFDQLHFMLEDAFVGGQLSDTFLRAVDHVVSQAEHPLYTVMHESIYCQGTASNWAAQRVLAEFDQFDVDNVEVNLLGEMMFPWMMREDPALAPLRGSADLIASNSEWPRLYDPDQLERNQVPVAAAIYYDDLYVDREQSVETAAAVKGLKTWITNEFIHDGLSTNPAVFDRLQAMTQRLV